MAASDVAVPATAIPCATAPRRSAGTLSSRICAHVGDQLVHLGRVRGIGAQVALGLAHHPGLGGDVKAHLGPAADDHLGGAAPDVEDQRRGAVG